MSRSTTTTISVSMDLLRKIDDYMVDRYGKRDRMFSIAVSDLLVYGLIYYRLEGEKKRQELLDVKAEMKQTAVELEKNLPKNEAEK